MEAARKWDVRMGRKLATLAVPAAVEWAMKSIAIRPTTPFSKTSSI